MCFVFSVLRNLQSLVPFDILYNDDSFKSIFPFFFEKLFTTDSLYSNNAMLWCLLCC